MAEERKVAYKINGKEYARLEDLPEPYRSILADKDGNGVPDVAESLPGALNALKALRKAVLPETAPLEAAPPSLGEPRVTVVSGGSSVAVRIVALLAAALAALYFFSSR